MSDYRRRSVEELTAHLREDPALGWSRMREFLTARGVDPAKAALAIVFPDDVRLLAAVVVVSADRMFMLDIEYPEGVDDAASMDHGQSLVGKTTRQRSVVRISRTST